MIAPFSVSTRQQDGVKNPGIAPVLKWAGGKRQLLDHLLPLVPDRFGTYLEPFFGGGALFFALLPQRAVISDSNPDLIHFYKTLRDDATGLIKAARNWATDENTYYAVRALDPDLLDSATRAARILYLNRTCYNGLYRVNAQGEFNVPFGKYPNPTIVDDSAIRAASRALSNTQIVCSDYREVLEAYARAGDFVFLDPPYIPVSKYSDFKRYTKKQFDLDDHARLANEVQRLSVLGCTVVLTNSNCLENQSLYAGLLTEVVPTKRAINSNGQKRFGEDLIVHAKPKVDHQPHGLSPQVHRYPSTRFMGSKEKLLADIWRVSEQLAGNRVLDLFSGSGCVSYMFKCQGKAVTTNDYMALSQTFSAALIENSTATLSDAEHDFLTQGKATTRFVRDTFHNLYFSDSDNLFIDLVCSRTAELGDLRKINLATAALIRACLKKRARGIFTYTGLRYDDGRRDLQLSLREHFREAVTQCNAAVFDNGFEHHALRSDALSIKVDADIVYIDPPYFSQLSDNDYVRRYHFVEGLAQQWKGLEIQQYTKTKKFKTYGSAFATHQGAIDAFHSIFRQYSESALVISYSSNSLPDRETIIKLLREYKRDVETFLIDHRYSFGNQGHKIANRNNKVHEYLFVAR